MEGFFRKRQRRSADEGPFFKTDPDLPGPVFYSGSSTATTASVYPLPDWIVERAEGGLCSFLTLQPGGADESYKDSLMTHGAGKSSDMGATINMIMSTITAEMDNSMFVEGERAFSVHFLTAPSGVGKSRAVKEAALERKLELFELHSEDFYSNRHLIANCMTAVIGGRTRDDYFAEMPIGGGRSRFAANPCLVLVDALDSILDTGDSQSFIPAISDFIEQIDVPIIVTSTAPLSFFNGLQLAKAINYESSIVHDSSSAEAFLSVRRKVFQSLQKEYKGLCVGLDLRVVYTIEDSHRSRLVEKAASKRRAVGRTLGSVPSAFGAPCSIRDRLLSFFAESASDWPSLA